MIKFGDVVISDLAKKHVYECLDSNRVTMGQKTSLLESKWSSLFGHKHTTAVSSGTTACTSLCMALLEMGAQPGDEVIVPALSFIATANAVRAANLTPVFVDVNVETLNINHLLIERAITNRTKAIMAVNLMGKPFDVHAVRDIANKNNLFLLGDCCESHGCKVDGKFMENYCDATAYSAYAAHILFGCELGFVCTNNDRIDSLVKSIRNHGRDHGTTFFDHKVFGLNFKPSDLHASIALGNVDSFWEIFNKRKENWINLRKGLDKLSEVFWFSEEENNCLNSPHAFSMVLKKPDDSLMERIKNGLNTREIEWKRNFGSMPTQHRAFSYMKYKEGDFPCAEHCGNYGIHVGVHQFLSDYDIDEVVDCILDSQ